MKDMKSILLTMGCWLWVAMAGMAQSDPGPWDGSISSSLKVEGKTIYIYTPADLAAIHDKWKDFPEDGHHGYEGYTIKLMNDLDMNGRNFQALTIGWTSSHRFGGVFDGQGHTIKNLWIDGEEDSRALFGWICGGDILNLKLENPIVRAGDDNGNGYVGALCGKMENHSVISHCAVIGGRVEGWNWDDDDCIGAICGWADNDKSRIDNCYVVNTEVCGHKQVGGIIGKIENNDDDDNVPVSNCYFAGTIRHNGNEYFGAIAGERYGNPLSNNFFLDRGDGVRGTGNDEDYGGSSYHPDNEIKACNEEQLKAPLLFGADNTEWIYPINGYPELKVFLRYNEGDTFYEKSVGYMDNNTGKAVPGYLKVVSNKKSPYTMEMLKILPGTAGSNFTLKGDFQPYFSDQPLRMATLPPNVFESMGTVSTITLPATLTSIASPQRHQVQNGFMLNGDGTGCMVKDGGLYDLSQELFVTAPKTLQTLTIYQQYASSIADYAFENMSGLKTLYVDTYVPAGTLVDDNDNRAPVISLSGSNVFKGCPADLDIYVKDGTTQGLFLGHQGPQGYGYSNATGWDVFYSDYADVDNHLFSYFPVKCNPGGMSTLMLGYPVELPAGVKAWWARSLSGGIVCLERLNTQIVPALTPVLLTYEGTGLLNLSRYEGPNPGSAIDYEGNLFKGSVDPGGHNMTSSELMSNFFTLGRPSGDSSYDRLGFYQYHPANNVLPSYVAWIAKSDIPANARWEVTFDDDITVTGIEEVRSKRAEGRSAAVYDLQGRKVAISHQPSSISHTKKGLYIVNGHKVVVK